MKNRIKNNITFLNIITNLILQIVTIISGFIIPKIILIYFGSEINGLVSSVTQFLSYISLIEGGITGVVTASLYKPLFDRDYKKLSSVVKTTDRFYKKIGAIFIIYSLIIAFVYPVIFNVQFSYIYTATLVIILSLNLLIQYMFSLTMRTLLSADKKVYIVAISQTFMIIANIVLAIISVKIYPSIHLLKLITGILYLTQPIIYGWYIKKNYKIDKNVEEDKDLIKSRWNGFAINIAAFIHFSTDITILTIFTDFATVSIYSVYALVTTGLRQIVSSISAAINPTIGHLYASQNKEELNKKFDIYEYIIFVIVFLLFSVAGLLITPFVMLYTKGITDANYYQPLFGVLLVISEGLYLIKFPHLNLAYIANKFKEITIPAFIEAGLNIIVSIILVKKFGLIGVAVGTIVGMLYRMVFHVYYTKKDILGRPQNKFYKSFAIFSITTFIGCISCLLLIPFSEYSLYNWIKYGVLYTIIMSVLNIIISVLFYNKEIRTLLRK